MTKPIKVGVVGCGYWGPNLIRNFRSLSDCSLKMMCDVSESRLTHLRSLYPEVAGETNYNHMLNGAGLDAVVIATSVKTHFPMAKASLFPPMSRSVKPSGTISRWRWYMPNPTARPPVVRNLTIPTAAPMTLLAFVTPAVWYSV